MKHYFAHEEIKSSSNYRGSGRRSREAKREVVLYKVPEDIEAAVREFASEKMRQRSSLDMQERLDNMEAVKRDKGTLC
jgi:polyribonucleotide nucleotidyltransferase